MIRYAGALRKLDFKWSVLLGMVCLDTVWMLAKGWSLRPESLVGTALLATVASAPLAFKRYRDDELLFNLCESVTFSLIVARAAAILSYLAISANFPLIDQTLAGLDQILAFNWADYYRWSIAHPAFDRLLVLTYESLTVQSWLVVLYLCYTKRRPRIQEFLELTASLLAICVLMSIFIPAAGAPKFYAATVHVDASAWSHFELLRSGTMTNIDLESMQGLVSMPSVHTVMAILLCWAVRKTPLVFVIVPINILLLLSTPVVGGHYIADVLAGALITAAAIGFRQFWCRKTLQSSEQRLYLFG
jgi:membrane-associated phospholipid phosphatase